MKEYKIERVSKENLHNLIFLYKKCFNLKSDLKFFEKRYNTISFGAEYLGFLAFEKKSNTPVGYYGVLPMQAQINGNQVFVGQSVDAMTHPEHQGKGIFTQLAKSTHNLAAEQGMDFLFAFPNYNKHSYPGFKKLNWIFHNEINHYSIKTGSLPFDKLVKKLAFLQGMYNKYVRKKLRRLIVETIFPNPFQHLNNGIGHIIHDKKFFQYKIYFESFIIKLGNVVCIVKVDGRLWIGDIKLCTEEEFLGLVDELIVLARKLGCSSVHFSMTRDTFYDKILRKKFEIKVKSPIGFQSFNPQVDPKNFIYQAFDFDTY